MIFNVGRTELIVIFVGLPLLIGLLVLIRFWIIAYFGISERISIQRQSLKNQTEIIDLLKQIKERLLQNTDVQEETLPPVRDPITKKQ